MLSLRASWEILYDQVKNKKPYLIHFPRRKSEIMETYSVSSLAIFVIASASEAIQYRVSTKSVLDCFTRKLVRNDNEFFMYTKLLNLKMAKVESVTFHNFQFSGRERVENAEKWLYREHARNGDNKILSKIISASDMIFIPPQRHILSTMTPIVMNQFIAPPMFQSCFVIVAKNMLSVTLLKFFHILSALPCLTRENARQGTAGRGF